MNRKQTDTLGTLRQEILRMQGQVPARSCQDNLVRLGPVLEAFPQQVFPTRALHEWVTGSATTQAATTGFVAGILQDLMQDQGICIWISPEPQLFPPGFRNFGLDPERIIFLQLQQEKEICWAMETCLQQEGLSAVIGELRDLDFYVSRRLQLAVEKSGVPGFVLRSNRQLHPTAAVCRWHIQPIPGDTESGIPGLGFPGWEVALLKMRGGYTGSWKLSWKEGRFEPLHPEAIRTPVPLRKIS
ncbi:ImuA family protein [Niabella terrae]